MAQEVQNVMKEIRLEKVVLNMGLGKSGEAVEIAKKALGEITNKKVVSAHIYKKKLRWEIPSHLKKTLKGTTVGGGVDLYDDDYIPGRQSTDW